MMATLSIRSSADFFDFISLLFILDLQRLFAENSNSADPQRVV